MAERSHISVVEGETAPPETQSFQEPSYETQQEDTLLLDEQDVVDVAPMGRRWLAPALAILGIAAWTGLYAFANQQLFSRGIALPAYLDALISWSVPVLLILGIWLVAMRNSTREAARYNMVARGLAEESQLLERRLVTVNRELSLAREFLESQARDLEYLGRSATERISEHAERLQGLIVENGHQVDAIAGTSTAALDNMEKLRDNLPVIANSAKDVSNQIGGAGRSAQVQLGGLVAGFERLNEFGEASERQVSSLRARVDDALTAFSRQAEALHTIAAERFTALAQGSDAIREDLQAHEIEALSALQARSLALRSELAEAHADASDQETAALDALKARIVALRDESEQIGGAIADSQEKASQHWRGQIEALKTRLTGAVEEIQQIDAAALDAANAKLQALLAEAEGIDARITERHRLFEEDMNRRSAALTLAQDAASDALQDRMAEIDDAILARRTAQREQIEALSNEGDGLVQKIGALSDVFATVAAQGHEARESIAGGIDTLSAHLRGSREALDGTDQDIARLTDASVRLLELLQASAKQSGQTLPAAMVASEDRLAEIERRASGVHALLEQATAVGEGLTSRLGEVEERTQAAMTGFDAFQQDADGNAARQLESVEQLRAGLADLAADNDALAERVQNELTKAIALLEEQARGALASIEDDQARHIATLAERIGAQSAEQIDKALRDKTDDALAQLDEARARSNDAAREMTQSLRDQLGRLNELTVNLESRIEHARDKATDTIDSDFARRVALITESLNSNSIDIAKALSSDVTDTAWASYLRGDRGIFTRRAVRLMNNSEAREIAELYDNDVDFREHVNRYIHDFESMLRTLLSTRDGNAVSVTLLSSDMGKLYVVLAQALERLRQS